MRTRNVMAGVLAAGLVAGSSLAEEGGVGATLDLPALSAYVWRGQVLNDEAVVQPSFTVTKGGLSVNVWGSLNLTDRVSKDCGGEFSEVDLTVSYGGAAGPVTYGVGLAEYLFPHQIVAADGDGGSRPYPGTRELFVTLGLAGVPLAPTLSAYYDLDEIQGLYAAFSVGHKVEVATSLSLAFSASIGYGLRDYNEGYFGVEEAGLNDGTVGLSVTWSPTATLSVTPGIQYVALLDDKLKDAGVYFDDRATVGSLKISIVF